MSALQAALEGHTYEIIIVDDDSPDGTADRVREIGKRDLRVRCIQRIGRRGLSGAFIEGGLATAASIVAVIDGDMQHDEAMLPAMLKALRSQELDVVIGSRYLEQGGVGDWTEGRMRLSQWATALTRRLTGVALSDPMSGFFMVRADVLRGLAPNLSGIGFKILLDIFLTARKPLRCVELPYRFRARSLGTSKMDTRVVLEFLELLIDKVFGHLVPAKFVIFALVGSLGVVVHLLVLVMLFKELGFGFETSQTAATLVAMTSNFTLNNVLTYYDRRLVWMGVAQRVAEFCLGFVDRRDRQCRDRIVFICGTRYPMASLGYRGCARRRRLELFRDFDFYMEIAPESGAGSRKELINSQMNSGALVSSSARAWG